MTSPLERNGLLFVCALVICCSSIGAMLNAQEIDTGALQDKLRHALRIDQKFSITEDPRAGVAGVSQGLRISASGGDRYTLSVLGNGTIIGFVALEASTRCGERYIEKGQAPLEPEADEEMIRAVATDFLDAVTTGTLLCRVDSVFFDGQDSWKLMWRRYEADVPYDQDVIYVEVCDRGGEVLLYFESLRSKAPSDGESIELIDPITMPPETASGAILSTLNESFVPPGSAVTDVRFENLGLWIVNPNLLFNGISAEQWGKTVDRSRDQHSAYAIKFSFRASSSAHRKVVPGEIWIAPDSRTILGGIIQTE